MINISRVGIGCHKLQGGLEKKRSYQIISKALDNNINYFDTAPRYGDSEVLLGEFLKGQNDIIISSKVGLNTLNHSKLQKFQSYLKRESKLLLKNNFDFAKRYLDNKLQLRYQQNIKNLYLSANLIKPTLVLSEGEIRSSLTSTLNNLKRNHLDLYFLHEPEQYTNIKEILEVFANLKNEGLIRFYGLGFHRSLSDRDNFDESLINLSMFKEDLISKDKNYISYSIIHGVMGHFKYALSQIEKNKYDGPIDFLNKLIELHPNKTFLMAPSNIHQISGLKV
jgi:predicted aldo/keto reductase-like oxidoreductase